MELVPKIRKQYIVSGSPAEVREKLYAATDPTGKHKTRPLRGNQVGEEFVVTLRQKFSFPFYLISSFGIVPCEARIRFNELEKGTQVCIVYKRRFSFIPHWLGLCIAMCAYQLYRVVKGDMLSLLGAFITLIVFSIGRGGEMLEIELKMDSLEKTIKQIIA